MQAVIASGGKQYLVAPGDVINVELVDQSSAPQLDVLLLIDGDDVAVGTPHVSGVTVGVEVVGEVKGEKIKILRFKAKKRVKRLTGHRQRYTQLKITGLKRS